MYVFEVEFIKDDVTVSADVHIDNDLLDAIARGKIINSGIGPKFLDGANVQIRLLT